MIGLDTNVLVRYLTQDDPEQSRQANALVSGSVRQGGKCFVGPIVLCELVWVLRGAYDQAKDDIVRTLDLILATRQFDIGDKDLVRRALEAFRGGRADFADYLIGASDAQAGCTETVTFDRRLRGAAGFRVL